jgi:hypothetical protein
MYLGFQGYVTYHGQSVKLCGLNFDLLASSPNILTLRQFKVLLCYKLSLESDVKVKAKAVPLHAMEALGGRVV